MKVIVGNMSYRLRDFIKKYQFTSRIKVINKMCNVKTIKGDVDIIIPFGKIEQNGLITNTQVHFEELMMSVDVKSIKFANINASDIFNSIGAKYGVNVEYIDIKNDPSGTIL